MKIKNVKNYSGEDKILYSKTKNYNYYKCLRLNCKGELREDVHTGQIKTHRKHSSNCYNLKKLESLACRSFHEYKFNCEKRIIKILVDYGLKKIDRPPQEYCIN